MDPSAPFRVRRVLCGVVAGVVLLALGGYGWVQYRQAQYAHRQHGVLTRYEQNYAMCVAAGNSRFWCTQATLAGCRKDPFWHAGKPFSFDANAARPDPDAECRSMLAR